MNIIYPNIDLELKDWPKDPEAWEKKPEITFALVEGKKVVPGDRIQLQRKRATEGPKKGMWVVVFIIIAGIVRVQSNGEIVATAKRLVI
jgi:hypothetical protein